MYLILIIVEKNISHCLAYSACIFEMLVVFLRGIFFLTQCVSSIPLNSS